MKYYQYIGLLIFILFLPIRLIYAVIVLAINWSNDIINEFEKGFKNQMKK